MVFLKMFKNRWFFRWKPHACFFSINSPVGFFQITFVIFVSSFDFSILRCYLQLVAVAVPYTPERAQAVFLGENASPAFTKKHGLCCLSHPQPRVVFFVFFCSSFPAIRPGSPSVSPPPWFLTLWKVKGEGGPKLAKIHDGATPDILKFT